MADPLVPISWDELLDKCAILVIKRQRLNAPGALSNVLAELAALEPAIPLPPWPANLVQLRTALTAVNQRLWTIEDQIREHEAAGDFGARFIALARAVYRENDERGRIKRAINQIMGSTLREEKQYAAY